MQDYNIYPYYDDFDKSKNFHRVLFKPGIAVQARELTQLQTILQDQITKFGNHIFKHGSVVIPGNSFAELGVDSITITAVSGAQFDQQTIIGQTSGVTAFVKKVKNNKLYLAYIQPGTNGEKTFEVGENVNIVGLSGSFSEVSEIGTGSLAFVNEGVYYINGVFVTVLKQTVVMSDNSLPSAQVLLKITESVVTADDDTTLLDPAQGSYNYAAPGSDRQKISLELVSLPLGQTIGDDYIELMRYNQGVLEQHNRFAKYSELERNLARRTYDESGDYLVNGYSANIVENLKTKFNNGHDVNGNRDLFTIKVTPGKAYIRGFEVETLAPSNITVPKARTTEHIKFKKTSAQLDYGSYILVTDLKGLPDFTKRDQITLWNDNDPTNGSSTQLGTARVFGIDYFLGDPNSQTAIYKLYLFDSNITDFSAVGGLRFNSSESATVLQTFTVNNIVGNILSGDIFTSQNTDRAITVHYKVDSTLYCYKHDHTKLVPVVGDVVISGSKSASITNNTHVTTSNELPFIRLPNIAIKSTKTEDNTIDTSFVVWKTFQIITDPSGNGSYTLPFGTFNQIEPGSTVAVSPGGVVDFTKMSLTSATTFSITGGPINSMVTVSTQVFKQNSAPKTKVLTTATLNNVVPASIISLQKTDIFRVVSIVSNGIDITEKYVLDNGQRDFYYGVGTLTLNGSMPTANLTIVFEYFAHTGSGDYFSPHSYPDIEKIPSYRSVNSSRIFDLSNYIDFRPSVSDAGAFSGISSETIVNGTFLQTSYQHYVGRIDVVYIDKSGRVNIINGIPGGAKPNIPPDTIDIATLLVPAYTFNVSEILIRLSKKFRYTMSDIRRLENRVGNIEYFSTLNAVENSLLTYDIIDANTGLNRFKTGYLVDNFENPFTVADKFNKDFRCTNTRKNLTADISVVEVIPQFQQDSQNYQLTGTLVSLPYTEVPLVSQLTSTRVTNLNPFMVFSWEGSLTVEPPIDSWTEIEQLETIRNSRTETITIRREVRVDAPAPPPPPPPPVPPVPPAPDMTGWVPPWSVVTPAPAPIIAPAPAPAPEPRVPITVFARDLGLVDANSRFNSTRWNEMVTFEVPTSVSNELNRSFVDQSVASLQAGTWFTPAWQNSIVALNQAFTEFGGNTLNTAARDTFASGAEGGRHSVDEITAFWEWDTGINLN